MKLVREGSLRRGTRAVDVLRGEPTSDVEFDPATDLPPEIRAGLDQYAQQKKDEHSWYDYAIFAEHFQLLFPDKVVPVQILVDELRVQLEGMMGEIWGKKDLVLHFLVSLKALGVDIAPFEAGKKEVILREFIADLSSKHTPFPLKSALSIHRLGWKNLEEVFPDKALAWERTKNALKQSAGWTDLAVFATYAVQARILFPEHSDEIEVTQEQLRRMKSQVLGMSQQSKGKIVDYGAALFCLTADQLSVGENGKIQAIHKSSLPPSTALPVRPIM